MRPSEAEICKANDHVAAGRAVEAKAILRLTLNRYPEEKGLYHDAVNIYLAGKMFEEAIEVFGLYKKRFGEELRTDYTLEDINKEKAEYQKRVRQYDAGKTKVFTRMSIYERGRLSNLPMIFPVREITMSPEGIILKKGKREFRYQWPEVVDVRIEQRKGHKGYFLGEDVVRTLLIRTGDRTFKIDISARFPDFKDSEILLRELQRYKMVREA